MNRIENAVSLFKSGFACSQAIVASYCDLFGLDQDIGARIAAGFGGGMGRMGRTCGAAAGAFMIIGLKYGASSPEDKKSKEKTHQAVRDFSKRFMALNGSLRCRELIGCDLSSPAGLQRAREKNLFYTICPKFVKDAAEILEEVILLTA